MPRLLPKTICPVCGKPMEIDKHGNCIKHGHGKETFACPGSGKPPKSALKFNFSMPVPEDWIVKKNGQYFVGENEYARVRGQYRWSRRQEGAHRFNNEVDAVNCADRVGGKAIRIG